MAIDRYELYKQMKAEEAKPKEQKKQDKEKERYEQYKAAKGYVSTPDVKDDPYQAYANRANQTIGQVVGNLSNSAIWRDPKALTDLQQKARMENLDRYNLQMQGLKEGVDVSGLSGAAKFYTEADQALDARSKYYAQFGGKDKFVGAQIDGMDKRQVREPSAPVAKADILPKNTNDYIRFQSEQMMGAGPQTIGTNPIAEMMEKQKFFQQTAHDPQALQFAKFTGEYDQMGRDGRLGFESAAIEAERKDINKRRSELENSYNEALARLYSGSLSSDEYDKQDIIAGEWADKLNAIDAENRLSMLDSMQGQVESTQRWNETKDEYVPYMAAAGFERESRYDQSKLKGQAAQEYASQVNDPDYTYNYINNPELWEAKTGNNQIFQYENAHLQYLTDEERGIYNYLYKNQGPEAAKQMLGDMAEQLRARRSYEQEKETAQYAKNDPVGSFFEARGRNLQKAVIGPGQIVATLMGAGADDPIFDINRVSESIDATNAQELSKAFGGAKIPFLDADAGEVVYGIMSSGADAAAAMGIGKLLLGSNAAIQGIMSSGAASSAMKSALERGMEPWKAATMGVMGGLIEAVTEKYSIEALFSPVDKKAWRFFLKNVFTEGSEELASSALNRITDGLINADKSEIAQRAQEIARLNGIPLEQATKQARTEWMQQAGVEFISGAVMGGAFAGPKALVGSVKSKSNPTPPTVTDQIANKEAEIAKKESEAYENAARERMDFETRDGEAAKQYAELVKLVNESFPEESETKAKIAEAVTIDTKRMTEIATNAMQELRARMQAEPTPETLKLSEALTQTVEGIFAGMQTDRNAITDKYTAGLDEGLKAEIKGKNDVSYAKGYGIAHALGAIGVPLDTIAKVKSVSTLQETAQEAAQQGQAKWEAALPQIKAKAADLQKALPKPGQGGVIYRANVKQEALSTLQRDQIGLLEKIAKPLGYNFVMMEFDKDAQGNYVTDKGQIAPNGFFRDSDGTIYIDVNAGKTAGRMVDDTIIPLTAGHELGHYLKAASPELFRDYSAAVVEELVSKGTDIDALIAKQIGRGKLREITVESAIEEMIMESGAMMLSNSQAAQKMSETNPGLVQKIAEWVKDFVDSIRKAFSRVDATPEAKAIMQEKNGILTYSDKLISMWDNMAVSVAQSILSGEYATLTLEEEAQAIQTAERHMAVTSYDVAQAKQGVDYAKQAEDEAIAAFDKRPYDKTLEASAETAMDELAKAETVFERAQQSAQAARELHEKLKSAFNLKADRARRAAQANEDANAKWQKSEQESARSRAENDAKEAARKRDNYINQGVIPNVPGLEAERPSVEGIVRDGLNRYADEGMAASERDTLKFQMREPVEETAKLIAVHNLSEAHLLSSVELGGFAMPSIAVIRAGQPHDGYGDISIVFGKETIDPENYGNKVYGGDAWTPSFPEIQYEIGYDEVDGVRKKVKVIVGDELYRMLNSPFDEDNLQQEANRNRGDFGEAFQRNPLLIAAYLKSIGEQANIVKSIPTFSNSFDNETVDLIDKKIGDRLVDAGMGGYDDLMALEPEVRKIINGNWSEKNVTDDTPVWRKILFKDPFPYGKMDGLVAGIVKKRNWDGEAKVDRYETERELVKQISGDKEKSAYKSWVNDLLKGVIVNKGIRNNADTFTPSGNRRSFSATHWAVTLENVVRAMRSQEGKGSDSWGSSGLFGVSTKNYSSLDDIRKDIDRLQQMDEEQYQEKKDEFQNRIVELAGEIARPSERNRFTALDNASEVLTEAARKGTTAGIQRVLNGYKDYYNIREDTAKKLYKLMSDISRMPTEYFEAKPERAVGFDEVRAVIIPDTASDALKKALDNVSAPVIEYKADDNADRLKALNSPELDGVKFQERDAQYLAAVESGDMDTAQKMVDEAADKWAQGVTLLKGYHGTNVTAEEFGDYIDDVLYITDDKITAQTYGKYINTFYVRSDKPFFLDAEGRNWNDLLTSKDIRRFMEEFVGMDPDYAENLGIADEVNTTRFIQSIVGSKIPADVVVIKNVIDNANTSYNKASTIAMVFSNAQVKRADPVTYDDSGNIIPLSQRFTDSNDIRFQERDSDNTPLSPEQIEYFKDSKVRDGKGRLVPVYHGTEAQFNTFRRGDIGFHFGTKGQARMRAGRGKSAIIIPAYLNLKNPLKVNKDYGSWTGDYATQWLLDDGYITQEESNKVSQARYDKKDEALRQVLKDKGYDGIKYLNYYEGGKTNKPSYIAFDANQIKRTDNLTPTSSPDIRYQERDPAPAMYSKMEKSIEDVFRNKSISKVDWRSLYPYLKKNGVTADEMRWSGISTFFNMDNPKTIFDVKSFSKAELLEFAKASAVQIDTIMFDEPVDEYDEENGDEFSMDDEELFGVQGDGDERRFKDYALPDGDNYRELIFTAPDLPGAFQSSHWPEDKNVLAHARLQDFQTPDGKPVLFVEEVQSDWHEKGREQGYKTDELIAKAKRESIELERERKEIIKKYNEYENLLAAREKMSQQDHERESVISARLAKLTNVKYMPDEAPFATTWHEYVLKRVLRMAAEGGYDYVGWTTGKIQADRYSLENQIGSIWGSKGNEPGTYIIDVADANGNNIPGMTRSKMSSDEIIRTFGKDLGSRLVDGIESSKKNKGFEVSGRGLSIGGEGMKAFYDIGGKSSQNIPRFLNKYGAQWGAKIQTIDMQGGENTYQVPAIEVTDAMKESVLYEGQPLYQERDSDNTPLSPEQIEYFKDSKVRDEQGRLLKVYHGTTRGFTEFKTNLPGQTIKDTIGSHFGTEKAANDRLGVVGKEKSPYGENVPSVMDVFLNITNPLLKRAGGIMTESELNAYLKRVGKKLNIPDRELGSSSQFSRVPSYVGETIQAYLKEQGYDGIPYINSWEDRGNVSYIAFSPEQIKSTTNLTPTSSPDMRYQERDPDYRTKRDILAGAFDSVAQTEGEKRNLKEYKNLIGSLNRMEEEARGLRQANTAERKKPERDKAVIEKNTKRIAEIEERINNLDKRLLKMQNAAPLQNVLKREVDYYKKQQIALNKQQLEKYRADRAETSMKQRYRNDISKGVKTLNNTLMNESDQKHIPEGFKAAVIEFLKLFTDNTSVFDYKRLSVLKEMYDALETSDSELAGMYDFDIAQDIADAARLLEGKRLSQLTEAELEKMRDIVAHFNHIVKNENQIFTQKRSVKTTDAAEEGLNEYGKKAKEMRLALLNGKNPIAAINKFLTSKNIKPVYFFKRVGGILQELFDDIRAAQGKWAFRMNEDRIFFRNTVQKYNYYKWADDGQLTFKTARGDQITLTRDQALELYAINKREKTNKQQGAEHLAIGGFVYEDAVKVKKKSALGVPMTYEVNVGENHPLTDSDLEQISKWLTNEQQAFADEMVNYLSTVMGERGNEVSLALFGLRKYKEKYYFPYKSASNYLYSHQGGVQDDSAIKHRSFTKRTTVSANNPVVLTGFTKVWADHVQNMNLYNAMAVPLDNFNRVYNYRIRGDKDATKAQSVKAALEAAYGKEANAYIKQLLNDVNGGIRPDKGDAEARKMMSLWKKGAVFASLSVVVQQPSAIGRALALIDPKHFRKGYTKAGYEEMMKWSGTANIKAMGRFDANMGMTAADWLTQREYTGMDEKAKAFAKDGSFRDDVLSWLPQKADEMTWTALWEAVKRETASRHGNLIGTDAFMQKVAERFDEVVDYTQVYDSVLSRSEVMRSQSALAQMVTSFMAEPTTAYNMLLDSIANRKNKGMKNHVNPGRALGAFAVSVLLNSILKAMVTAGRDDDEKYTYLEKYLRKVSGSIADELNPLGLVPYGRDILSLWEGYDIERADMSLIGDLIDAAKKMSKTDTPILQRMDVLAGAIGNALGIPYKNVRRDIQGVYNVLANTAPMSRQSVSGAKYSILEGLPWFDASRAGYARKLYSAIVKGDAQEEAGLREQISKIVKKDSDINTELRKIITTEFEEERLEPRTALQQMIDLTALKEVKGKIGDWYKTGLITEDVAEQLLVEFTDDDQPNERYKKIEEWNYSKDPDNEGESYSIYKPFYDAIDSGKDLRAVVNTYMDPKKYGATKSTLSGRITDTYKDQYIEAYRRSKSEAASLKARLLNAYVLLGYDRAKKGKDIDDWLKQ